MAVSLLSLPIIPGAWLKPTGGGDAAFDILRVLFLTIGLPYFLLSTTGPLLQDWIAHRFARRTVYRMFALSNFGSLAGLLAYPFVVEPLLDSRRQALLWSGGYIAFVAACAWVAWQVGLRRAGTAAAVPVSGSGPTVLASTMAGPLEPTMKSAGARTWTALSALGVVLLLATTNQLLQNVASVPFLWVLPLSLYLLSFIVVFEGRDGRGWYSPRWGLPAALLAAVFMAFGPVLQEGALDVVRAVPLYGTGLFVCCIFCHGELARCKPPSTDLTRFYFMLAVGGALGGIFVGLLAPRLFDGLYEFPLALVAVTLAAALVSRRKNGSPGRGPGLRMGLSLLAAMLIAWVSWNYVSFLDSGLIAKRRDFYGILRVREEYLGGGMSIRTLFNGVITHGMQLTGGPQRDEPGTYYSRGSGVGLAIGQMQNHLARVRVGVIGLGVGTLAAYGRPGDSMRFYELDPEVVEMARNYFTYLKDTPAQVAMVVGDARISLERESGQGSEQSFDVLVVDAFTGDSIPVHLITRQAFELYVRHLAPGGLIAVHISNRFLDLEPVLARIVGTMSLTATLVHDPAGNSSVRASSSDWVLLAREPADLLQIARSGKAAILRDRPEIGVWTDGYNNLFRVMKFSAR